MHVRAEGACAALAERGLQPETHGVLEGVYARVEVLNRSGTKHFFDFEWRQKEVVVGLDVRAGGVGVLVLAKKRRFSPLVLEIYSAARELCLWWFSSTFFCRSSPETVETLFRGTAVNRTKYCW